MPLTTVTTVVEPISSVPVGETELEVGSESGAEVEGIGVVLEKVEAVEVVGVVEIVGIRVGEDKTNIDVDDVGIVIVGVVGSRVIDCPGNDIVLVFVVKNVVSREQKHIPSC